MRLLPKGYGPDIERPSSRWATIEHLDHLPPFTYREGQTADDFAIACSSYNSSRGQMPMEEFIAKRRKSTAELPLVITAYLNRQARR